MVRLGSTPPSAEFFMRFADKAVYSRVSGRVRGLLLARTLPTSPTV